MAKHLNVNLDFNANTSKAQSQIQSLVSELNKLSQGVGLSKELPITQEILEAQHAAKQLGMALEQATNVDTGKLDLTSFNQQLKNSGMTLQQYSSQLTMLGSAGDKAFLQVAQSIVNTEAPLRRSNAMLQEFATTLQNTARWQISSMILHGFISALQSAHGYAQDLNESLNNIRIVTGANADEMARFAQEANKAAKALSTTTTEYTNASLIYFQQGLSEEEVKKRADITIKMANVSRQSAEEVSEQLTAVWNNFYDGTKALEYYADVMTALGAATASSSEEIADGLNKFAAVAETVGLSYEYAAAALATVTATTRQSADVVGTAFKTLFARLNDLKLGETLDDGTTLGTYTENLAKVGVQIKDANGDLKNMDSILSETAEKWKTLDKDQQVALAKGVAGLRQYTQFIALMDNWDFMEENLATANNSIGELSNQADIYAESWEASSARVKASLENIYQSLIDDEFFINLNNTIAKIVDTFGLFIDSVGGVKGVLLLLGSVLTKVFGTQMAASINNAVQNFRVFSGLAAEEAAKVKKEAYDMAMAMTKDMDNMETTALRDALTSSYEAQERVAQSARHMSEEQKLAAEQAIKVAQSFNEQAIAAGRAADAALKAREAERSQSSNTLGQGAVNKINTLNDQAIGQGGEQLIATSKKMISVANTLGVSTRKASEALKTYETALNNPKASKKDLTKASNTLLTQLNEMRGNAPKAAQAFQNFQDRVDGCAETVVAAASDFNTLKDSVYTGSAKTDGLADNIKSVAASAQAAHLPIGDLETAIKNYDLAMSTVTTEEQKTDALKQLQAAFTTTKISTEDMDKAIAQSAGGTQAVSEAYLQEASSARVAATAVNTTTKATAAAEKQTNILAAKLASNTLKYQSFGTAITGTLQGLSSFAMGLNSIKSAFDTLKDPDIGTFEKFTSLLMSLGMGIPMLISSFSALGGALQFVVSTQEKGLVVQLASLVNAKKEVAQTGYTVVAKTGEVIARKLTKEAAEAEAKAKGGNVVATNFDTAATLKNTAVKIASNPVLIAITVAVAALTAALYFAVKAYNADAEAAKKAAETAEKVAEAHEAAKQELEDLRSTFNTYDEAVKALEECTKGTDEWYEALKKVNDTVLDILANNPELMKQSDLFTRNSEGMLELVEAKRAEILAVAEQKVSNTQAASMFAAAHASEAAAKAQATSVSRHIGNYYGVGDAHYYDGGVYYDQTLQVGSLLTQHAEELMDLDAKEYRTKVRKILEDASTEQAKSSSLYSAQINNLVEQCMDYQVSIQSLGEETANAATQMRNVAQMLADIKLGDDYSGEEKTLAGYDLQKKEAQYKEGWLKLMTGSGGKKTNQGATAVGREDLKGIGINAGSKETNAIYEAVLKELQAAGYNWTATTDNAIRGSDTNRRFVFTDENGKQTDELSVDWIAQEIAAAQALRELSDSAESAKTTLQDMDTTIAERFDSNSSAAHSKVAKSYIASGNMDSINMKDFNTIIEDVNALGYGDFATNAAYYFDKLYDDGQDGMISAETAEKYFGKGVTPEEALKQFQNRLTTLAKEWKTIELPAGLLGTNNVTLEAAKNIQDAFAKIDLGPNAKTVAATFTRGLNSMLKTLDTAEQEAALQRLVDIDWSNWDAIDEAKSIMAEYGVTINETSAYWQNFATEMRIAAGAMPDYSKTINQLQQLHDAIEGVEFGDIIDQETFDDLIALDNTLSSLFLKIGEDKYKVVGNTEQVGQAAIDAMGKTNAEAYERQQAGTFLSKFGTVDTVNIQEQKKIIDSLIAAMKGGPFNAAPELQNIISEMGYDLQDLEHYQQMVNALNIQTNPSSRRLLPSVLDTKDLVNNYAGPFKEFLERLDAIRQGAENDAATVASGAGTVANSATSYEQLDEFLKKGYLGSSSKDNTAYQLALGGLARQELGAVESFSELQSAWDTIQKKKIQSYSDITEKDYIDNLLRLAENSEIATLALEKYEEVVASGDGDLLAAQKNLEYALTLESVAQQYELNTDQLQGFITKLLDTSDLTANAALEVAVGYMKMAEEMGISAEALLSYIDVLNTLELDPTSITAMQNILEGLGKIAQETGLSIDELVNMCANLSKEFNLTGESAEDAIAITNIFAKSISEQDTSFEELKIQTEEIQQAYKISAKDAAALTVANQRMNKGVADLNEAWEDLRKELSKANKTTTDYAKAAATAEASIRDLLNLSDDFELSDTFFDSVENLDLISKAAEGDEEAIRQLGMTVATDFVASLDLLEEAKKNIVDDEGNILEAWGLTPEKFDEFQSIVQQGIAELQQQLGSLSIGSDVTGQLGDQWIAALNEMALATNMSVEQMNSMLSSMGVSANVVTKYVDQEVTVPEYTTTETVTPHTDENGITTYTKVSSTVQTGTTTMMGQVPVAAISTDGNPETPDVTYIGRGSVSDSAKGSDKGGGPATTPKTSKFKEKRHVEKDDQIDDIDEEIKDLERALDNASGADKVALIKQIQDAKDRKAALINEKLKDDIDINEYLDRDEEALATATGNLSQYGVEALQVDSSTHNITNYEAIWNQIRTKEKELLDAWNNDTSEANEKALNDFYDFVSQFEEAYDRFVDTREEAEDFANEIEDLKSKLHEPPDLDEVEDLKLDEYEHAFDDITTSIEAMERATEKASKEADNLYGAKRAQALSRVNSSIQQEIGLLNKKIEIAKKVAKFQQDQLKMSLLTAQASLGAQLQFEFAADGSITNLSAVMEELIKKYNELVETYKNSINAFQDTGGGIEDWEKEQLDQMEAAIQQQSDFISKVSDSASRYNETLATISESMDSIADKQDEIKSNNYEILSTKLSYALDMTNAELQRIDYQLNKVADDIYKMGEAAGILSQKVGVGQDALAAYTTHMNDLNSAYQQGYIHESDYVAGLQEVRDGMYSELGALQELDKEMMNYYGETLSAANEEIGKYTDRMDSLNSVLDHYQSLMTLIGKETDYKAMGIVLQGAADTAKNSLAVAQATAEFYAKQAAEKKLLMENAIEGSKAFELYKKEWEAAEAASREAKENMLAKTQEWAEREKAIIENNFKDFKKSLEEALTGGSTFDYLSTQMERSVSLQEEYLTATNQIYETTKMINTAQKAIDQTTNTAAKRELKSFIQKTEQLKNQNKLSKYELDLHQAQYQILQAQIALEEAQNAKSTVRLRRDSAGNFGYVYTADTSKIADAEQKLADAQNAYYNKSLEGANKYVQNYTDTLRNMQDELTALTDAWMQGEIQSEEEYNRRKEEIVQFYGEKLKQYSHLYQTAISADSRAVADAWSTDYANMITDTQNWQEKVDDYAELCIGSMQKWQAVVTTVQQTTGMSYDEIAAKVHSVVTESEALVKAITDPENGVIQAMQKQLDAVSNVTTKYAEQELALDSLITQVEAYITSIDAMIAKVGQANSITLTDPSSATVSGGGGVSGGDEGTTTNNGQNDSAEEDTETKPDPNIKPYQTGVLTWTGTWEDRVWTDSAGNTYAQTSATGQKIQKAFTEAWKAAGKEYKGDWFLGWNRLNADELHEKYGLSTGGYTGDWAGPMGKLAFLHQKEIVLNKDDTANLLAAVDMLRTILHTLDVHSMSAQLGGILSTPGFHMGDSGTLEQNVKIEASFPNVQDHNEIEEAFNNLINKASQYANRK